MNPAGSTARADALVPAAHPFSRHLRRVVVAAPPHRAWTPADGPYPPSTSATAPYLPSKDVEA